MNNKIPYGVITFKQKDDTLDFGRYIRKFSHEVKDHFQSDDKFYEDYIGGLVFVIMPINEDYLKNTYPYIKKGCKQIKLLHVEKADDFEGSDSILDNILHKLDNAEFIIVDLTDERPNVYFELGYVYNIHHPRQKLLLIAKDKTKLHFDILHDKTKFYKDPIEIPEIIKEAWDKT